MERLIAERIERNGNLTVIAELAGLGEKFFAPLPRLWRLMNNPGPARAASLLPSTPPHFQD